MWKGGKKEKLIPTGVGICFVIFLTAFLYYSPPTFGELLRNLQNLSYDLLLRLEYRPVKENTPIVIVDIDDSSIEEVGRWPWDRKKLSEMIGALYEKEPSVVVLDIIFPDKEENVLDILSREYQTLDVENPIEALPDLEELKKQLDYDRLFAKSLSLGSSVLGFAFTREGEPVGKLPKPLFKVPEDAEEAALIPSLPNYLANLPVLQDAAKSGGFINVMPDPDGVIRYAPLLLAYKEGIYASLALSTVMLHLGYPKASILVGDYKDGKAIEGLQLGEKVIPTDATGRILIPFRGPSFSVPYVSAADVLKKRVPEEILKGKIIFIGSSATALGDIVPSASAPSFVGVEVHAHIASGILEEYLPYKPTWEKGVRIGVIFICGLILAISLPYLGPIFSSVLTAFLIGLVIFAHKILWKEYAIAVSVVSPIFSILFLYVFNEMCGYLIEGRKKKILRSVFGQYVPPECIDTMLETSGNFGLEGELKELTILFTDIRKFTTISEGLSATELKNLLNDFLTPMTEVIFEKKGTIDKYVGDAIMAFWGAPLENPAHFTCAVEAAFSMQNKVEELNKRLEGKKIPRIEIGIGINTGSVSVGDMGSKYRRAYTVLGDPVNLASRLESLTKIYRTKIIVGEKTYNQTKDIFTYRFLDKVRVKGKEAVVNIFEPLCKKGEENQDLKATLDAHQKGIDAYFQRRWDEALSIFEGLKRNDPLYEVYMQRIESYKNNPPPEGWDGAYDFLVK